MGQETGPNNPPINDVTLAVLLGIEDLPLNVIMGKPKKDNKSVKAKKFTKRVQRKA